MFRSSTLALALCLVAVPVSLEAKKKEPAPEAAAEETSVLSSKSFSGLPFRSIGPAITSGRISEVAVVPGNEKVYYVATSSGGVWKTENSGTTFKPIFDSQGSYSIGTVTVDPNDPAIVWVGTGENNSQRSVGYGDGVYKSVDGGRSWKNVGLGESEHIARIAVDPRDSNTVFVAAQGPLWGPGGDRGLFKTTDGGETWTNVLEIDEHTGVTDLVMDLENPDTLYAASYQRRRHVWTLINGGPGSGIHKSTDGGETWTEINKGLPSVDMGRIGLAQSPANPGILYAIVEAAEDEGGFFRSIDGGANWEKRSDYVAGSPQYYNEIVADPKNPDRVYSMDTWMHVTDDGGKSFRELGELHKHIDNHSLWIDPNDTDHQISGNDGGVYETFDGQKTWLFKANLPVTQFYKVEVDNHEPFYRIYGGTQDNFTLGGPTRTTSIHGIVNSDWFVTTGGDGFQTRVDPEDSDIIYSQSQYGGLVRYDHRSGEEISIVPQPGKDDEPLFFNWDAPLIISPHSHTRLYYGANRLFRSDDRGDSWTPISPNLTRQIDRNKLEVMDRVWSVDAVSKNRSTSFYGNLTALSESPLVEGLIYVGTDDGLVQVTEDGGANWRQIESFPGVPERTYVNDVVASVNDADTVFALFNNHKNADFKPYVLKSTDRGASWTSMVEGLPERGSTYSLAEDHVDPNLLFVGTEFGAFFSQNGGQEWIQLEAGLPTVAVRGIAIQRRESDLVLGTFGRGFYVLDDYSPLRGISEEALEQEAKLYPVKNTWAYMERAPLALRGKSFQGEGYYSAPNPPFGAVFTYYLKDGLESLNEARRKEEKKTAEDGGDVFYPSWEELRAEDREEEPAVVLTVTDQDGNVVRRLTGPTGSGFHRVAWDLRYPPSTPTSLTPFPMNNPFRSPPVGPMAVPGTYSVSLAKRVGGELMPLGEPQTFETVPLGLAKLATGDREALLAFQAKAARLQRAALGAVRAAGEAQTRIDHLKAAIDATPAAPADLADRVRTIETSLQELQTRLSGDRTVGSRNEPTLPSIVSRVQRVVYGQLASTSPPTQTNMDAYQVASDAFGEVLGELTGLIEEELAGLEGDAEAAGAPWTPGRVPSWQSE
jgi:photosystem II stability/assembly factor-like uncharacterized protein